MMETTVLLKPEVGVAHGGALVLVLAAPLRWLFSRIWPDRITHDELAGRDGRALQLPGHDERLDMPIKNRIDMLSTGIRTPVGIKILGPDLTVIERSARSSRACCAMCRARAASSPSAPPAATSSTSTSSATQLARYGLTVDDAQMIVMSAIGGENVTTTIEGRERYPVNVRYARELRDDRPELCGACSCRRRRARRCRSAQIADIRIGSRARR